jgi:PAS domain S-box-containing protein
MSPTPLDYDRFRREIERFAGRARALGSEHSAPEVSLRLALDELTTALEELHVAEEELRRQNDELSRAHDEVEAQRRRFRELFMSAPDGYLMTDERGLITEANRAAAALTGVPDPAALRGKPMAFCLGAGHRKDFYELLRRLRLEGAEVAEAELTCGGGRRPEVPCVLQLHAVRGPGGLLREVRCVLRDLTEREQARRADGLAEEMRHRDDFLAQLGHELRNPLTPVATLVSLLREGRVDEVDRDWVHDVLDRQVRQLGRLVDDMLDAARLARGQITLQCHSVDLGELVRAQVDAFRPRMSRRQQTIWSDTGAGITVHGDPTRLRQVIDNLLDNACKYTPAGGTIWVELGVRGDRAVLQVRDDGAGILPGRLEQVFEPYQQPGDPATDGLSLGLSLVRHLVELHGGRVRAASEGHGRGTELTVELELATGVDASRSIAPPSAEVSARRVLVVDDDLDAAEAIALALRSAGHEVRVACDADTALSAAREFFPELGLIDLGIPGTDGYEIARQLATEQPGLRLIAVTGFAGADTRARARDAGFGAHLPKPVDLVQLEQAIAD